MIISCKKPHKTAKNPLKTLKNKEKHEKTCKIHEINGILPPKTLFLLSL